MNNTIAVVGAKGLLGSAFLRYWNQFGNTEDKLVPFDLPEFDLCARSFTLNALQEISPQIIINAAGINNIDWLETHPNSARNFHLHGTANLREAAGRTKAFFVQFSCSELFYSEDPLEEGGRETDPINPVSIFARTKADAEDAALEYSESLVIRLSTLFGDSGPNSSGNLVETLLAAFRRTQKLHVLNDISISPLWTFDLIRIIRFLIEQREKGLYHIAAMDRTTPFEVANFLQNYSGLKKHVILPITSMEYGFVAPHSNNNTLNTDKYRSLPHSEPLPNWRDSLKNFMDSRQCTF